ncbi:unnamed protein product [Camellia sinensis]
MKVHPAPKKRNITIRYNIASTFSQANALACRQKKLRRLPHIFAKVLELPFHSDADVLIDETSDCFRFVVNTDDIGDDIRAQTIEIYPGVTKIVIRGTNVLDLSMDELELDMWRFRLPASTRPELASAAYNDGQLVVMVPKDANFNGLDVVDREEEVWGEGNGDIGAGRLVLEFWRDRDEFLLTKMQIRGMIVKQRENKISERNCQAQNPTICTLTSHYLLDHGLEVMKEREVWGLEFVILSRHARSVCAHDTGGDFPRR